MQSERKVGASVLQFMKFGIVGVSNTAVSLIFFYIFQYFGVHYLICNTIGFIGGTLNAYFWNSRFVFQKRTGEERPVIKTGVKVFMAYGLSYLLSQLLLIFWMEIVELPKLLEEILKDHNQILGGRITISNALPPVLNVCVTTPINFFMNKLWAFRGTKGEQEQ